MRFSSTSLLSRCFWLFPVVLLGMHAPVWPQTAPAANEQEAQPHENGWMQQIESALIAEKFDDLEQMADKYRREKSRLNGGDWRLRYFYSALDAPQQTDKDSMDHIAHLEKWMKLRPESITPRLALSASLNRWAWVARGNGFANAVTPDAWKLFSERIKDSLTVLQGSENMKTIDAQFYSEMLTVGLAQSWDAHRMHELFERGIQLEPDYFYLYRQYANYLLPKWDGKPGDASAFAKESADHLGGNTGDQLYFQIATLLVSRSNGNFPVKELDWQRIQRGYHVLGEQYGVTRVHRNQLAFMAYKFQDAEVAREQFTEIGDDWSRNVWRDRQFFDRARDWARS